MLGEALQNGNLYDTHDSQRKKKGLASSSAMRELKTLIAVAILIVAALADSSKRPFRSTKAPKGRLNSGVYMSRFIGGH